MTEINANTATENAVNEAQTALDRLRKLRNDAKNERMTNTDYRNTHTARYTFGKNPNMGVAEVIMDKRPTTLQKIKIDSTSVWRGKDYRDKPYALFEVYEYHIDNDNAKTHLGTLLALHREHIKEGFALVWVVLSSSGNIQAVRDIRGVWHHDNEMLHDALVKTVKKSLSLVAKHGEHDKESDTEWSYSPKIAELRIQEIKDHFKNTQELPETQDTTEKHEVIPF